MVLEINALYYKVNESFILPNDLLKGQRYKTIGMTEKLIFFTLKFYVFFCFLNS